MTLKLNKSVLDAKMDVVTHVALFIYIQACHLGNLSVKPKDQEEFSWFARFGDKIENIGTAK